MKLTFLTLNLWQGGNLFDAVIQFIKEVDPDILALQEVYDSHDKSLKRKYRSLEVLKKTFPELKYFNFAPAFLDNRKEGKIEQGNAVFSKFPIINSNVYFYQIPYSTTYEEKTKNFPFCPRNLQETLIQINNKQLYVYNTQGIWGLDGKDSPEKIVMSNVIVKHIKNKKPVILAGDFNLQPNTQTIYNIEVHLRNVFKNELISSFNMKRKDNPGYATAVVDMVFTSKEIKIIKHVCPQVDISDHLPLIVQFQIPAVRPTRSNTVKHG